MNTKGRLWISVSLGLLAIVILFWFVPKQVYKPVGILLPTKPPRSPISPATVVRMQDRPASSELLGHINIERKYLAKGQLAQQQIWALAQKRAAEAGANAVIIKLFQVGALSKRYYIYVFQAEAIYVPNSHSALGAMVSAPRIGLEF